MFKLFKMKKTITTKDSSNHEAFSEKTTPILEAALVDKEFLTLLGITTVRKVHKEFREDISFEEKLKCLKYCCIYNAAMSYALKTLNENEKIVEREQLAKGANFVHTQAHPFFTLENLISIVNRGKEIANREYVEFECEPGDIAAVDKQIKIELGSLYMVLATIIGVYDTSAHLCGAYMTAII